MKVLISKRGEVFEADAVELPGHPAVGRGASMLEALGDFLHHHRAQLGIELEVDATAEDAERARRQAALDQR